MRIALIPGSMKPYHVGHHQLVLLAARECDEVHLFVSTSDREEVSGEAMKRIWDSLIEPVLPANVQVTYGGSPVGNAFAELGKASDAGSKDTYVIYSDPDDAGRFGDAQLQKYAANVKVERREVQRASTTYVSGTAMREFLRNDDFKSFSKFVPREIDASSYWKELRRSMPKAKAPKPKPQKKKPTTESVLRSFVREVIRKR